jgi:hypothetical protein
VVTGAGRITPGAPSSPAASTEGDHRVGNRDVARLHHAPGQRPFGKSFRGQDREAEGDGAGPATSAERLGRRSEPRRARHHHRLRGRLPRERALRVGGPRPLGV